MSALYLGSGTVYVAAAFTQLVDLGVVPRPGNRRYDESHLCIPVREEGHQAKLNCGAEYAKMTAKITKYGRTWNTLRMYYSSLGNIPR